jgi:epoxyqueuosine reductase
MTPVDSPPRQALPPGPSDDLAAAVVQHARRLGFDRCRILPVGAAPHADFFDAWLAADRAGEMGYLARHAAKRRHPGLLAEGDAGPFRSLIVLAVDYHQFDLPPALRDDPSRGLIASYAWGDDYHEIIRPLLYDLDGFIRSRTGRSTPGKCLVDTGPVLERDWAHAAGIGFTGKNCCTIDPAAGSWLLLATALVPEVLTSMPPVATTPDPVSARAVLDGLPWDGSYGVWELPAGDADSADAVTRTGACGRCTRCLSACPTRAFAGPYHLDPQRCISYWTIEARQPVPRELRPNFGNRIFGCDICQEVCPWNRRLAQRTPLLEGLRARTGRVAPPLLEGFSPETPYWLDDQAFGERFRRSPVRRAKRSGMLRNVCIALGNWAEPSAMPALLRALHDSAALARGHAAWALGRLAARHGHAGAARALADALRQESDEWVRSEIAAALA